MLSPPPDWHELTRSPAAMAVGRLAARAGLGFAHFEHTVTLPEPEAWAVPGRPDLGVVGGWRGGVLPESKFRHFRLDRMVAGFHPGHRAKWSSHELLHRLVGFAWTPDASPFWLAAAARLAELLPVALWYHLDEIGLRRCSDHADGATLFDAHCAACEEAAAHGPVPVDAARVDQTLTEARAFVARERDAIARSLREGRPIPSRWFTIDLCSDGLAWAAAHGPRLASPAFATYVERFFAPGLGWHPTLDALDARVESLFEKLAAAVCAGAPAPASDDGAADPEPLRRRWIAADVAWRLLTVREDCGDSVADELDAIVDGLAASHDVATAAAAYRDLHADFELPEPEDVFAVGYDLGGGLGRSVRQIREGLATAVPSALRLLGADADAHVEAFVRGDGLERRPLGLRFARHLIRAHAPAAAVDAARLEALLTHAPPQDPMVATLAGAPPRNARCRMASGVTHLNVCHDPTALLRGRARTLRVPVELAIVRSAEGQSEAVALSEAAAADCLRMRAGPVEPSVGAEEAEALRAAGVWCAEGWAERLDR
jgi:hypothetical protein